MYLAEGFGDFTLLQPVVSRRPRDVSLGFEELWRAMHLDQRLVSRGHP